MSAQALRNEWLCHPLPADVDKAIHRIARSEGVVAVAVMPDVHLSKDVCVGTVTATDSRLIPNAVGGDIGCGMRAVAFDVDADVIDERRAAAVLSGLYERVPILRHRPRCAPLLPDALASIPLSGASLESRKRREAALQLGTVGRGNHFVELQRDDAGALWAMVHSGSRAIGQAIRDHHLRAAEPDTATGLRSIAADSAEGRAYLADAEWARAYARANRAVLMKQVTVTLREVLGAEPRTDTVIEADHNHVCPEEHFGNTLWVHRKGAQSAHEGELGLIPGSMGHRSFHVAGRGCAAALESSSHGAGRAMSRTEARRRISRRQLLRESSGVFFDHRLVDKLREEAPGAYKDIGSVMRAQSELVRIVRTLSPVLVFKGA